MKTVAIIYRFLPQYRVEFYEQLRDILASNEIELKLLYGQGDEEDRKKGDLVDLPWGIKVPNKIIRIGSHNVYWQPAFKHVKDVDLIIVEQASRLLINYLLLARQTMGGTKIAFWGHGKNFQATEKNRLAEWLKKYYSKMPHWWFAYNDRSARVLSDLGYPADRVTVVDNAIDTHKLRHWIKEISEDEKDATRMDLGISGKNVGVFVGGLYPEKRLEFLISSAENIREEVPDFELLIAGDGVDRKIAESASKKHSWIRYIGPRFGRDKAVVLSLGKLFLMPGLVGLAVLDAFSSGLPVLTTDVDYHSPEIDYLKNGKNGFVCEDDVRDYSNTVISILSEQKAFDKIRNGAIRSGDRYTIENMAAKFAQGIISALMEESSGRVVRGTQNDQV